jgi:hypothetical protein
MQRPCLLYEGVVPLIAALMKNDQRFSPYCGPYRHPITKVRPALDLFWQIGLSTLFAAVTLIVTAVSQHWL